MTTTPRTLSLRLPLPPASLNPNARLHWARKATAVKLYRRACWAETLVQANGRGWSAPARVRLGLRFVYCTNRHSLDADNALASLKAGIDGLRDARVLWDDDAAHVQYGSITVENCPRKCRCGGAVIVTVEEVL